MTKKIISLMLIFAMLIPFSPAVAADDTSAAPTVEEILNSYHEKAFAAQFEEDTASAATYSRRSGTEKTLEQETVDELTAAGYEAYNVTSTNYDALEESLKTDFSSLGLDPNGSFIIVIGNSESENTPASNSRVVELPNYDYDIGSGGDGTFNYEYNGVNYKMRQVTITSATGSHMNVSSRYDLEPQIWIENAAMDIASTALISMADSLAKKLPLGTILSLICDWATDDNYAELEPDTLIVHAATTWTCSCIQVWNDHYERWETAQCSAYAVSKARCAGYVYNPKTNTTNWYEGLEGSTTHYSPKYASTSQRWLDAAKSYISGSISYDTTGDINFYLGNEDATVIFNSQNEPLFTHVEGWGVPLYA